MLDVLLFSLRASMGVSSNGDPQDRRLRSRKESAELFLEASDLPWFST
jgi:hypothetical protein